MKVKSLLHKTGRLFKRTAVLATRSIKKRAKHMRAQAPKQMKKLHTQVRQHKTEVILVAVLMAITGLTHAWNMFSYPYYENDEATYISRAWMVANEGELDVYTYRYDHAPLGWILLSGWVLLTGGDNMLAAGRVLMLFFALASALLVYILAKRLSGGSKLAGTVAVLLFALSPLAIYFHRRILLDNIMTFWLLLSLWFVTHPKRRLKYFMWSGIAFGIAVLTKLNAVFLGPAFLFFIWIRARHHHRIHAMGYWLAMAGMVVAAFFLYALLKGELLSAPLGPDGMPTHVSVVDTFTLQLGRGEFAWPWIMESSFIQNILSWGLKDWFILGFGALSTVALTAIGIKHRKKQPYLLATTLLVWCYVLFLARGKLVIDLYIVPAIPLLALATGVLMAYIYRNWLRSNKRRDIFIGALVVIALLMTSLVYTTKQYSRDEVTNQTEAAQWMIDNVPKDAIIATDNYLYPILAQENGFTNVSYFFSTEYDPEIRKVYDNDWRNVEYLVLTHEVVKQIKEGTVPRMKAIFDHAELLADYRDGSSSFIDLKNYISTNGDWVQIYKVKSRNGIVLQDSWQYFKDRFVVDYGQVVDLTNEELTTSAGQATAMLRAVEEGDRDMFDGLWQWSKDHLRYRATDKMLSWKWEKGADGKYALADSNTVCDADQQLAYALFKAHEKWGKPDYHKEAVTMAGDWWRGCVLENNGKFYILSSADGSFDARLLNPGYFHPAIYMYLATKMPDYQWERLVNDNYEFLYKLFGMYGTIPNWTVLSTSGALIPAEGLTGVGSSSFGYDALQLIPRLVEYSETAPNDPRPQDILSRLLPQLRELARTQKDAPSQNALLLAEQAVATKASLLTQAAYETNVHKGYKTGKGFWSDGFNYRDHVWFWQWHRAQDFLQGQQQVKLR